MIRVRRDKDIYEKEGGWFRARWHFSFDDYFDPENTSFGSLRVFNDDRLIPGAIWPLHPHRDAALDLQRRYSRSEPNSHRANSKTPVPWPAQSVSRTSYLRRHI